MTFADAAQYAEAHTTRCLLCSKPALWRAVFIPTEPRLWLGPPVRPGKTRGLFYGLCKKCFKRRDRADAVEACILRNEMSNATGH